MGFTTNFGWEEILPGTINWEVIFNAVLASVDAEMYEAQGRTSALYNDLVAPGEMVVETGIATLDALSNFLARRTFDAGIDEGVVFNVLLPETMIPGGTIGFNVRWMPTDSAAGNVRWLIAGQVITAGAVVGAADWTLTVDSAAPTTTNELVEQDMGDVTPSDFGGDQSTIIVCRIRREGTHANDTYGAVASLLGVEVETLVNT